MKPLNLVSMKTIICLLIGVSLAAQANAQYIHKIKADSVLITNDSCTAELNLENSTKHIKGFLYNKGNGRTEFRKAVKLNDSTLVFGEDTLVIRGNGMSNNSWKLTGNSATNPTTNFLGTSDNQAFSIRTDNVERMRFNANGNIGIGNNSPLYKLSLVGPANLIHLGTSTADIGGYMCALGGGSIYLSGGCSYTGTGFTMNSKGFAAAGVSISGSGVLDFFTNDGLTPGNNFTPTQRMVINNLGLVGIGCSQPRSTLYVGGGVFGANLNLMPSGTVITSAATSTGGYTSITSNSSAGANSNYKGVRSRGSLVSPTALTSGDEVVSFEAHGYDGSALQSTARIVMLVDGTVSGGTLPGAISFRTGASNTASLSEKMRIASNGNVGIGATTPTNLLHVSGTGRFDSTLTTAGARVAIRSLTVNSTLTDKDQCIFADGTSGAFNVTLPTASGRDGQQYTIKKTDASANTVTVNTTSSQTIDGNTTYALPNQWDFVTVIASGGNWLVVGKN